MIFLPDLHEYWDDARTIRYRSVTEILKDAGEIDDRFFTAEARERGSAVHALCQRYANGERVDDLGRPLESLEYVNALAAWFRDKKVYAIATEKMIEGCVNGHKYAGTFDLLAEIGGKRVLVDYKTGAGMKWHPAQIAAYALEVNPNYGITLQLKKDGRYKENVVSGGSLLAGLSTFRDAIPCGS